VFAKRRASSLASTLLLIAICVGLAFTVVSLAFHHLNMGNRLGNSQQARNLAESAISLTMEKILKAEGDYPKPGDDTVEVHFPSLDAGAFGVTTFNVTVAGAHHLDVSWNNLKKDTPVNSPNGHVVPKEAVYLVGLGHCAGVDKRVEAILQVPIFQSAISAEAGLDCQGPMLVASADTSADDDLLTHPENYLSQLKQAHVTTNQDAVLGQDVLVTGFVQAAGAVDTSSGNATVKGGIRPQSGRSEVPALDVNDFDPAKLGKTHALSQTGANFHADGGLIRMVGDVVGNELTLPDGVSHSGAIVWVKGDIKVKEIRGVGAIIATGNITVSNSTNLSSDGTVAMLSGGNLSLTGQKNDADAIIKGIAYAGASLAVSNVTLVGTMVQAGTAAADSLHVDRANFIKTNDSVDFEFDMPFGIGAGGGGANLVLTKKLADYYDAGADAYAQSGNPLHPVVRADFGFEYGGSLITPAAMADAWLNNPPPDGMAPLGPSGSSWLDVVGNPATSASILAYINSRLDVYLVDKNQELVDIEAFYQKFKLQPKQKGHISFNPSRFLTLSQAVRIILWKDQ